MKGFWIRFDRSGWLAGLVVGAALLAGTQAMAHGPTRQKTAESIEISAPPSKVWAVMGNFDALKDWHPAVASSPADKGNEPGSVRTIELKGGGRLIETLQKYDASTMSFGWRLKDGSAIPVSNYTSSISISGEGEKSTVEWRGAFYRAYPNNNPPPEQSDEAALKAVTEIYTSGLANLKKIVESK